MWKPFPYMIPCVIGTSNFSYAQCILKLGNSTYGYLSNHQNFFSPKTHWQKRPVSKDLFCKLARSFRKAKWKFKFIFATFCHGQIIPYLFWRPSMCWCLFYVSEIEFLLKNEVLSQSWYFSFLKGDPMRLFNGFEVVWLFMLISSRA